jgi:hypothetical protein
MGRVAAPYYKGREGRSLQLVTAAGRLIIVNVDLQLECWQQKGHREVAFFFYRVSLMSNESDGRKH